MPTLAGLVNQTVAQTGATDPNEQKKKLVKVGGQLQEQSQPGLQGLVQAAGTAAAPITPAGGAAIGANPDQAKMLGVGDQKVQALRASIQSGQQLDTQQRQASSRTEQSGAEQQ